MRHILLPFAMLSASPTACSFIPNYHRPALPVTNAYPSGPASAAVAGAPAQLAAADLGWRQFFSDPVTGLTGTSNIREYSPGIGAVSRELDLFGKIRSTARASFEDFLSDVETRESTQIALIASVDSEYLTWLADRDSLAIAQETAAAQQSSVQLTELEASTGTGTALDVAQAQTTLFSAQASEAQHTRQIAQDMDEIVLPAGAPLPGQLLTQMAAVPGLEAIPPFPVLPAGLPSDLLERRPDIRAAEDTLLADNASIGAARADFFPSITLTANDCTASDHLGGLFGAMSGSWLFEPEISVPIFAGGENLANLDIA